MFGLTVGELKDLIEGLDDDMPVKLAVQPSWPFEHGVDYHGVVTAEDTNGNEALFLAEAGQSGYLPGNVRDELGW